MIGVVEVEVVAVELDVAGVVEVEVEVVELVEDETGEPEVVTPVVLTPVVFPAVVLLGDLQADASGIDAMAVPAATMPMLFRTCRLVNSVTRKMFLFPWTSFLSFSAIFSLLTAFKILYFQSATYNFESLKELLTSPSDFKRIVENLVSSADRNSLAGNIRAIFSR